MKREIPIWKKISLTIPEASLYSGIGTDKLYELTLDPDCEFVLWVGSRRIIKRRKFDLFLEKTFSI